MEKDSFSRLEGLGIELEKVNSYLYLIANAACSEGLVEEHYTTALFDLYDKCKSIYEEIYKFLDDEFPKKKEA